MNTPQHILVIRFSALGDVAMTVPVLQQLLEQHPQVHLTVVSQAGFAPLFTGLERCSFHPAHLKSNHQGAAGIAKLYRELVKAQSFDAIADLHGVLRASLLSTLFRLTGHPVAVIRKGRAEKKALTRKSDKVLRQLTSTFERYAAVFGQLGLPLTLQPEQRVYPRQLLPVTDSILPPAGTPWVGVAPFAQHSGKMYPADKMKIVVQALAARYQVLLFGGKEEATVLQEWTDSIPGTCNMAGKLSLADELAVISRLSVMLSMDSANMHLASLYGVPVVSIWGATHPFAGFYGWAQDPGNCVSVELPCRPCSVFGNQPCWRGDFACMVQVTPDQVIQRVEYVLKRQQDSFI